MTADAQAALRRVIEKYTSNTRFCMICNYVNKIIPALQSRCTRYVDSLCSSSPPLRWLSSQVLEQHEKIQSYLRIMLCSTTLATLNPNAASSFARCGGPLFYPWDSFVVVESPGISIVPTSAVSISLYLSLSYLFLLSSQFHFILLFDSFADYGCPSV